MSKIDDGGPAFPVDLSIENGSNHQGMSLRDYFAGQALVGILGGRKLPLDQAKPGSDRDMSVTAYEIADAMIAARKPSPQKAGAES